MLKSTELYNLALDGLIVVCMKYISIKLFKERCCFGFRQNQTYEFISLQAVES